MSMRSRTQLRPLGGLVTEPDRTQAALAALAAGGRPFEHRRHGGRQDHRLPEADALAAFAARLRVGGLAATPAPREGFVDDLEHEMERAFLERQANAGPSNRSASRVSARRHACRAMGTALGASAPTGGPPESWRLRHTSEDRSLVRRLSRIARRPQATFAAAAAMVLLAMGGLSTGSEGLLASPTLTPTAGAASATPSPAPRYGGWLLEQDHAPIGDALLVAAARTDGGNVAVIAPGPAPEPRPTPRTAEHSG